MHVIQLMDVFNYYTCIYISAIGVTAWPIYRWLTTSICQELCELGCRYSQCLPWYTPIVRVFIPKPDVLWTFIISKWDCGSSTLPNGYFPLWQISCKEKILLSISHAHIFSSGFSLQKTHAKLVWLLNQYGVRMHSAHSAEVCPQLPFANLSTC